MKQFLYFFTALSYAVENGKPKIVNFLLDFGSDMDLMDKDKLTPLIRAQNSNNKSILKIFQNRKRIKDREDSIDTSFLFSLSNKKTLQ